MSTTIEAEIIDAHGNAALNRACEMENEGQHERAAYFLTLAEGHFARAERARN